MNNGRYPRMPFNHQMSIPREPEAEKITRDGLRLFNLPSKNSTRYARKTQFWKNAAVKTRRNLLADLRGEYLDIRAEFEPGDTEQFRACASAANPFSTTPKPNNSPPASSALLLSS